jgi:hypothetical protein
MNFFGFTQLSFCFEDAGRKTDRIFGSDLIPKMVCVAGC